jgi:hypothetical protein
LSIILQEGLKIWVNSRLEVLGNDQHQIIRGECGGILTDLKTWMLENYKSVLPKSTIGHALPYSLKCWDKLTLYATKGDLEIDNNLVEKAIRPIAVGRKNYLFAGTHNGAARAAMLYSFLGTCKINDANPLNA